MVFSEKWIKAVVAMYTNASSKVILFEGKAHSVRLSRSVRQGCPMAPYLFLFFAEAMSSYLSATSLGIQGLCLPNMSEELLDSEFADNTSLYVRGTHDNLTRLQNALEKVCLGLGAKLNWNKTVGFWVSDLPLPNWLPHPNFRWISEGMAVRYLGFQVGINLSPELQIAPLLYSIRKKLMYWSAKRLSLAGRIVIVNHVLLASMWYVTSCWIFVIQRLIPNYLRSGGEDGLSCPKIAWSTLTQSKDRGGLGLIDPEVQSKALLVKLMVRGHLPRNEYWKGLLNNRILHCTSSGGPWRRDCRWSFLAEVNFVSSKRWEDRFFNSLGRAWQQIKASLVFKVNPTYEAWKRQTIL